MNRTTRAAALARLEHEAFDVLVIGGGISGVGVALDAATRGLRCALIERHDFASGTSSRSSKLIHGGLRYLRQYEFGLVAEGLRERQRLLRNAPHLVHTVPFTFPVIVGAKRRTARATATLATAGLWLYDALGGWRVGKLHRRISVTEAERRIPDLNTDRVTRAFSYLDGQADDARLTLSIATTAALEFQVPLANYVEATSLIEHDGRVHGVHARDCLTGDTFAIRARVVINATGVWADTVRGQHADAPLHVRPAKGVHITIPRGRLPIDGAAILEVAGEGRVVFIIPWGEYVYLGTTDTAYDGDRDTPTCTSEDVANVLMTVNEVLRTPIRADEIIGTWAGLRPLIATSSDSGAATADVSRRHVIVDDHNGLITVTGGKLTAYREMAEDTIDVARHAFPDRRVGRSRTRRLKLHGATGASALHRDGAAERLGISRSLCAHLAGRHGGLTAAIVQLLRDDPSLAAPLVPGLPYVRAEAIYAARYEMALTLSDVLERRTRALMLDHAATIAAAPTVAALLAPELGWDASEQQRQVDAFMAQAQGVTPPTR
ncbi:MAG: glycerol-3-phosphate dehydrogenase/oxidase [Acidimicrobiia bacterium]